MTPSRMEIHTALLDLFRDCAAFVTVTDTPKHHQQVQPDQMPMVIVLPQSENHAIRAGSGGGAVAPTLGPVAVVYACENKALGLSASQALLSALDALDRCFDGPAYTDHRQTLKGLVHAVRMAGTVETDGGEWGNHGGAVVPLEVVLAP